MIPTMAWKNNGKLLWRIPWNDNAIYNACIPATSEVKRRESQKKTE